MRSRELVGRGRKASVLRDLWEARDLLRDLVRGDLVRRFSGSRWGVAWVFVQPILQILVLTAVFQAIVPVVSAGGSGDARSYALFLCAGFLPWLALEETLRSGCSWFTGNAHLILHTAHARSLFVAAPVIVQMLVLSLALVVFLIVGSALGVPPGLVTWALLPLLVVQAAMLLGLGLLVATFETFSRETRPLVQSLLPLAFWATPIVYHPDVLPVGIRALLGWNPLSHLVHCYRAILLEARWPDITSAGVTVVLAGSCLAAGTLLHRRTAGTLADRV